MRPGLEAPFNFPRLALSEDQSVSQGIVCASVPRAGDACVLRARRKEACVKPSLALGRGGVPEGQRLRRVFGKGRRPFSSSSHEAVDMREWLVARL